MKTLYEHADDVALTTEEPDGWRRGPGVHKVIAVYASMTDAARETADYPERDDIHFTAFGAPVMGRRTMNIVAYRADFLEAFAHPQVTDEVAVYREAKQRHDWITMCLMCRLLPGGRLILV